jgi:hypothetical protein
MSPTSLKKAPATGYRFGEKRHTFLLTQDDSIPGNRKDGFRYHYLIFVIISSPLYLWLELSFGVRLLDSIASVGSLEQTKAIEHWGRLISGCAVSLLFLAQWFGQCEKWDRPWFIRILIAIVICMIAFPLTWTVQSRFIDFYVKQGSTEIAVATPLLALIFLGGLLFIRRWLKTYAQRRRSHPVITIAVLAAMLGGVIWFAGHITRVIPWIIEREGSGPTLAQRLGQERQQAATLALMRRGMQLDVYTLIPQQSDDLSQSILHSPEGKAFLAMFPVLGSVMDQSGFERHRAVVLQKVMYVDWDEQYGAQSYAAYQALQRELLAIFDGPYRTHSAQFQHVLNQRGPAKAEATWVRSVSHLFEGVGVRPGLSLDGFKRDPGAGKYFGRKLACFDCRFQFDMTRDEFTHELFLGTQLSNVNNVLAIMKDPQHFESGHDGETAARTYWVPIWALLFSMMGAFAHIFKLTFTLMEYAHLRSFSKVHAADAPLANDVIANARRGLAGVMAVIVLFLYFSENRVTGHPAYGKLHQQMWQMNPLIGGVAAHWTINAQGLIYPFTKKIRPDWLSFNQDPLERPPLSVFAGWVRDDEY